MSEKFTITISKPKTYGDGMELFILAESYFKARCIELDVTLNIKQMCIAVIDTEEYEFENLNTIQLLQLVENWIQDNI